MVALSDHAHVQNKKVIFVQGPTACGKSDWALLQAERFKNSCIINCDSIQLYKHLNIGSSKPSSDDFDRIPHFLYDYVDYPNIMTAGQYYRDFYEQIAKLSFETIFVVGGTGFYFQAIENGLFPVSKVKSEAKEEADRIWELSGPEGVWKTLKSLDAEYCKKISPNDHYRMERALELMLSEGKSMTTIQREFSAKSKKIPFPLLKIGIQFSNEELKNRVLQRTQKMIAKGWIDEAALLVKNGFSNWDPMQSVGYKEILEYIKTPTGKEQLIEKINQSTMRLIKKQKTWFQRDKTINWIASEHILVPIVDRFVAGVT